MSVIVNDKMPIDLALRLLWREATREGIISTLQGKRYHVKASQIRHTKERVVQKRRARRRAAARKAAR
jgi:ribosomal protein S21